jgi:hypothetical protein
MLTECPKFSKFLHGMALLYPDRLANTPSWFVPSAKGPAFAAPANSACVGLCPSGFLPTLLPEQGAEVKKRVSQQLYTCYAQCVVFFFPTHKVLTFCFSGGYGPCLSGDDGRPRGPVRAGGGALKAWRLSIRLPACHACTLTHACAHTGRHPHTHTYIDGSHQART